MKRKAVAGRARNFATDSAAMSRETAKALVIICGMICLLAALLLWANHIRPHGY